FGSYGDLDALPAKAYDFILVCVKSPDSRAAAEDLARHGALLGEGGRIVLCQNGWGNAEIFAELFPKARIFNGRVITGFARPAPNEVVITVHADAIHLGSLFGGDVSVLARLAEAITRGGIPCETTPHIEKDLWAKMLYNCALNPLGAVLDVPYGVLAEHASTRRIMDAVVAEIYRVLDAAGFSTHWPTADEFMEVFYGRLVPSTAEHKSSTLQDILAGKATEIDALSGAVIELAGRYNVEVPTNICLYDLVKFLEAKTGKGNEGP
ncbi:MAG: 2-dehydropantoate 2-reductase, partial [Phycisphaerae bacterium]|nr:2-dehydropantoate 2-reductase [Phycisphaerae bacterium]